MYYFQEIFTLIEIKKKKIDKIVNTYGWWDIKNDDLHNLESGIYRVIINHQDPTKYFSCFCKCDHIDKEIKWFLHDHITNDFTFQIDNSFIVFAESLDGY